MYSYDYDLVQMMDPNRSSNTSKRKKRLKLKKAKRKQEYRFSVELNGHKIEEGDDIDKVSREIMNISLHTLDDSTQNSMVIQRYKLEICLLMTPLIEKYIKLFIKFDT